MGQLRVWTKGTREKARWASVPVVPDVVSAYRARSEPSGQCAAYFSHRLGYPTIFLANTKLFILCLRESSTGVLRNNIFLSSNTKLLPSESTSTPG